MQDPVLGTSPESSPRSALSNASKPKLLDQARIALRSRHYSKSTEQTYIRKDVKTTMIYTNVLNRGGRGVKSPADSL